MARLGATVWTGDINPTWQDLHRTPGMMLNWVLGGAPYVACDIGGFTGPTNPELLTRWMQAGVFMPTMRVHSVNSAKPHWPWLFGKEAGHIMRQALDLRYKLIPYHYSLAHAMYTSKTPWVRPLAMDFQDDEVATGMTTQWMDGDILVAPVLEQDSKKKVYVPHGLWYPLTVPSTEGQSPETIEGPVHLDGHAEFGEIPAYVRVGTLLPLAPVVQTTRDFPGGPLEVQVYAGADGYFEMVEDDGETTLYENGYRRSLNFRWDDFSRRLSWALTGYILTPGKKAFKQLFVTVFNRDGAQVQTSEVFDIGVVGSIDMLTQKFV